MPKIRRAARGANRSPRTRTKGFRPQGALADAALRRGQRSYNLWYLYGPKAHSDLVLSSDAEVMNAWWMELDPSVKSYQIGTRTPPEGSSDASPGTVFDARILLSGGGTQVREVESFDLPSSGPASERARQQLQTQEQLAALLGCTFSRVGPAQLRAQQVLIGNAKIAVATLAAARLHSIEGQHASLLALLQRDPTWAVGDLLKHVDAADHPLFLAAVFRALARGTLNSDLHEHRWGRWTKVWVGTSAARGDDKPEILNDGGSQASHPQEACASAQATAESHRASRTADVSAAMALSVQRAEECEKPGSITRKNIPPEYKNPAHWPAADLEAHQDPEVVQRAHRLRAALCGYLAGDPVRMLEQTYQISRSEILRLLNRALLPSPDGGIIGWRALLYGFHIGYERTAPIASDSPGGAGYAGALGQVLSQHPDIARSLIEQILMQGEAKAKAASVTARSVHTSFLKLCASQGIRQDEYPFISPTLGLQSIRRFFKAVREAHFTRTAAILGGQGAAKRSKLYSGNEVLLRHPEPFDAVQQDAHTLDVIGSVRVPHPKGPRRIPIKRFALQIIVEVESKAILGYSVCLLGRISAQDALETVQQALSTWTPLQVESPLISYPDGAGFPSGVLPELAGATWSTHYLDNDSAYTSELVAERIRNRLGCAVNWGPVNDWTRRFVVEGVFNVLEKAGFQRLPSTTGSHPKDPRRQNPEQKAVDLEVDYKDLIYLIDVALATYNATPLASLGYRSPLQLLRERTDSQKCGFLPRYLPPLPHSMPDMHIETEYRTVRGKISEGRRPYVEIDGVLHTNQVLADCAVLIGKQIIVHINNSDMRHVKAFMSDGRPLGVLTAQSGWNRIAHTRQMRKLINQLRYRHELVRQPSEDWVEAYLKKKTDETATASTAKPAKVSKVASQVADISHRTGQDVPQISNLLEPPSSANVVEHRTVLPSFIKRPVRRVQL